MRHRCIALLAFFPAHAIAQATDPAPSSPPDARTAPPAGMVPVPDYSGSIRSRRFLTGDWDGSRTDLANKGVQLHLDWIQSVQGVASGGRDNETHYGGNLDALLTFDLMRMGVLPGALVKVRAESRYGDSVNNIAGPILPVNTDAFFPLTDDPDQVVPFTLTSLNYTQALSEKFALFVGKTDTLDGDQNEFASGRGTSQFMNANFLFNGVTALRLPYSTLAAGFAWMPTSRIMITSSIMNTADSSTTTGFEDFGDGLTWSTEARVQYRLGDLPGGQNLGFLYSFDQEFNKVNGRLLFHRGEGLSLETNDETWAVYWSAWQYLWVEDPDDAPINLADGELDHQGVGLFARAGFADEDTNPVDWSASGGIGARGILPSRDNDALGIGYFYTSFQTTRLSGIVDIRDEAHGFEAFYDIAITPAAHLTLDAQVVESPAGTVDTAVVLGARLKLSF